MAKRTQSSQPRGRKARADEAAAAPAASRAEELPNIVEPGDAADQAQRIEKPAYESLVPASIGAEPAYVDPSTSASAAAEATDREPRVAETTMSESMSSEPSEADIRLRAYQRYLERGGAHGSHFDDWLAAEDELKRRRERK